MGIRSNTLPRGCSVKRGFFFLAMCVSATLYGDIAGRNFTVTGDPAAVAAGNERFVFARASDRALKVLRFDGTRWYDWADLGCCVLEGSGPGAASWGPGRVDVFVRGDNNEVWWKTYNGGWGGYSSIGGQVDSNPAAASWGPNRIDVVAKGTNQNLLHRFYENGAWSPQWNDVGCCLAPGSGAAIAATGPGQLVVYVRGTDNNLWTKTYANGAWAASYSNIGAPPGGAASDPEVFAGRVFVRTPDNAVWENRGSGWVTPVGFKLTSAPAATSSGSGGVELFARYADGRLFRSINHDGMSWSHWSLAWIPPTPVTGSVLTGDHYLVAGGFEGQPPVMLSPNRAHGIRLEQDGRLCVYGVDPQGRFTSFWCSPRGPAATFHAAMERNAAGSLSGRLCVYPSSQPDIDATVFPPAWCSDKAQTDGQFFAQVKDDGSFAVAAGSPTNPGGTIWSAPNLVLQQPVEGAAIRWPDGQTCPPHCHRYVGPPATSVTLAAVPPGSQMFDSWAGGCAGQPNPCTVPVGGNRNASVTFKAAYKKWPRDMPIVAGMRIAIRDPSNGLFWGRGCPLGAWYVGMNESASTFTRNSVFVVTGAHKKWAGCASPTDGQYTGWVTTLQTLAGEPIGRGKGTGGVGNGMVGFVAGSTPNLDWKRCGAVAPGVSGWVDIQPADIVYINMLEYCGPDRVGCVTCYAVPPRSYEIYIVDPDF